jgi:hypothetical protein
MSIDRMGGEQIINKGVLMNLTTADIVRKGKVFALSVRSY